MLRSMAQRFIRISISTTMSIGWATTMISGIHEISIAFISLYMAPFYDFRYTNGFIDTYNPWDWGVNICQHPALEASAVGMECRLE